MVPAGPKGDTVSKTSRFRNIIPGREAAGSYLSPSVCFTGSIALWHGRKAINRTLCFLARALPELLVPTALQTAGAVNFCFGCCRQLGACFFAHESVRHRPRPLFFELWPVLQSAPACLGRSGHQVCVMRPNKRAPYMCCFLSCFLTMRGRIGAPRSHPDGLASS